MAGPRPWTHYCAIIRFGAARFLDMRDTHIDEPFAAIQGNHPEQPQVNKMKRLMLLIAAAAAILGFADSPGQAQATGNAPWCAEINYGNGDIVHECYYQSAEQCVTQIVGGNRGFCNVNPYWQPPVSMAAPRYRKRHAYK
jgi:hypothetical protein